MTDILYDANYILGSAQPLSGQEGMKHKRIDVKRGELAWNPGSSKIERAIKGPCILHYYIAPDAVRVQFESRRWYASEVLTAIQEQIMDWNADENPGELALNDYLHEIEMILVDGGFDTEYPEEG